ncbi:MAG: biotin/lipoyl-containing protein, partial [Bacteroidales bacterium]
PYNPLTDTLPKEIDKEFDKAIGAVHNKNEEALLDACHKIEAYFNFPEPSELIKKAEIPGGMYTNMVAQLKQSNSMEILEDAMHLIPSVRLDSGLPPLVTPTSQIVGVQAVMSALNIKNGRPKYASPSNQYISLVKGEYGATPVPVDPKFREQITGSSEEVPYDTSSYVRQGNPVLAEFGNVKLAQNESEELLLELFPSVATKYLRGQRENEYNELHKNDAPDAEKKSKQEKVVNEKKISGKKVTSPLPGTILEVRVKDGDTIKKHDVLFILEAMKMENNITSDYTGTVHNINVKVGDVVKVEAVLAEIVTT